MKEVGGVPLTIGMQQDVKEKGLGPYTEIGPFGPGDELVVPMLHRGEVFSIQCNRPAALSAYRFGVYFRGVWLDFNEDDLSEIRITMKVRRMPELSGGDWVAPTCNSPPMTWIKAVRFPMTSESSFQMAVTKC